MPEKQQDNLSKLQDAIDKLREGIGDLLVQKAAKSLAIVDASEKTYAEKKKEKESQLKIWDFFKAYEDALPDAEAVAARRNHLLCKDTPTWEEPQEGEDGELPSLPKDGPLQPLWPMEKIEKTETWQRWDPEAGKPFPSSLKVWFFHWLTQLLVNQWVVSQFHHSGEDVPKADYGNLTCRNMNLLTAMLFPGEKHKEVLTKKGKRIPMIVPNWIGLSKGSATRLENALSVAQSTAFRPVFKVFRNRKSEQKTREDNLRARMDFFGNQLASLTPRGDKETQANAAPYVLLMTEVATMGRRLMQALLGEKHWNSANWKRQVRHDPNSKEFVPTEENLEDRQKLHAAELLLVRFKDESIMDLLKKLAAFDDISPKDLRHREASSADEICAAIAKFCPKPNGGRGAYLKSLDEFYVEQDNCEIPLNDIQYRLFCKLHHVKDSPPLLDRAETYIKRMDEVKSLVPTPSENAHLIVKHKALLQRAARMVRVFLVKGEELTEDEKREGFLIPGLGLKLLPCVEPTLDTEYRASSLDKGLEEHDGDEDHMEVALANCAETGLQTPMMDIFTKAESKANRGNRKTKEENADANGLHHSYKPDSWYEYAKRKLAEEVFGKLADVSTDDERKERLEELLSSLGKDNMVVNMPEQTRENLRKLLFHLPEAMLDFGALREARLEDLFNAPQKKGSARSGEAQNSPAESSDDAEADWKNNDRRNREKGDSWKILEESPKGNAHEKQPSLGIKEGKEKETMRHLLTLNKDLDFMEEKKTLFTLYTILRDYCEGKGKDENCASTQQLEPRWLETMVKRLDKQAGVWNSPTSKIKGTIQQLCEETLELSDAPKIPLIDVVSKMIQAPKEEKGLQKLFTELGEQNTRDQFIGELRKNKTIRVSGEGEQTLYLLPEKETEAKDVLFKRLSALPQREVANAVFNCCVEQYSGWVKAFGSSGDAGILSDKPPENDKRPFRERMVELLRACLLELCTTMCMERVNAGRKPSEGK